MFLFEVENKLVEVLTDKRHNRTRTEEFLELMKELKNYYSGVTLDYFSNLLKERDIIPTPEQNRRICRLLYNLTYRDFSKSCAPTHSNIINENGIFDRIEHRYTKTQGVLHTIQQQVIDKIYSFR